MRELAEQINSRWKTESPEKEPVRAGQLIALGLLTDILRFVTDKYCFEEYPGAFKRGIVYVQQSCSDIPSDRPLRKFLEYFPPQALAAGKQTPEGFLASSAANQPNREAAAREMILLFLSMVNRALVSFQELFDDGEFEREENYRRVIDCLNSFFNKEPTLSPLDRTLFELLYSPMTACPDSLEGQLEWILENWRSILPDYLLRRLLILRGILEEEARGRGPVGGSVDVLRFTHLGEYPEYDRYSQDRDWMPNVVLIAKSTYVWLSQLSQQYGRDIKTLDQIPDQELDRLAGWGFTGLWLIGLWERSPASRRIKQIMGNPEAMSSAYSLYDYTIASDLGGEEAYLALRKRAWQRGIRLASDMVPNHVGIYSRWVVEHPDWFIQLSYPPYPDYSFTGENLSHDSRVGVYIEDGYWNRNNAAVVFKRVDHWTGETRYIYHGNDGTHMPWNDTAQLDYLKSEVREAVIQTILHVARQFPIIRFDAAMTLAKKHYQRLWFPAPGHGGAIPSRSEHGMSREEFDRLMPEEFWREVVDRVTAEVPDTLLIAEAFWLMEGYFVRTLGMHRVYNSAFMNMLKMEENANYRMTMKNVLEFSPGILQRFVNFMNNPDERTAIEQFGKEDKYFGVAVLMVTMPGLPMFGHGQIEGFTERYGMEYSRSYWDEPVDRELVRRHEREIFPLMRQRYLFSGVGNFALFDFETSDGHVNEDVFAYSNRAGGERAVIIYNNRYNTTSGRIQLSTSINQGTPQNPRFVRKTLAEALDLNAGDGRYYVFRDCATGLEYLRSGKGLANEGLHVELHAYQYHAFLDFREIHDHDGTWSRLAARLEGKGVPGIERARKEMILEPVLNHFRAIISPETVQKCVDADMSAAQEKRFWEDFVDKLESLAGAIAAQGVALADTRETARSIREDFTIAQEVLPLLEESEVSVSRRESAAKTQLLAVWSILRNLEGMFTARNSQHGKVQWFDDWLLAPIVQQTLADILDDHDAARVMTPVTKTVLAYPDFPQVPEDAGTTPYFRGMMNDPAVQECLEVNEYAGVTWFNKERMDSLLDFAILTRAFRELSDTDSSREEVRERMSAITTRCREIREAAAKSEYQVGRFLSLLGEQHD